MSEENRDNRQGGYKRYISFILFAIFFVWIVVYIRDHWSDFTALRAVSVREFAWIAALAFLGIIFRGLYTAILTAPYGVRLGKGEIFFISLISTVGNYTLPMRGGAGLRAVYLKRKHGIGYREFAKISVARFSTIFLVDSVLGLVAVFTLWKVNDRFDLPITLVLLIALTASSLIHLSTRFSIGSRHPIVKRFAGGSSKILNAAGIRWKLILVTLLNSIIRLFWIAACFRAVSVDITLVQGLLVSSLIPLSMVVTLTPGNLGITEGLLIYVMGVMGIGVSTAIICSILMRSSAIFWSLAMIPFLRKSYREIKKN